MLARCLAERTRSEYGSIQSGQKQENDELPTDNHWVNYLLFWNGADSKMVDWNGTPYP